MKHSLVTGPFPGTQQSHAEWNARLGADLVKSLNQQTGKVSRESYSTTPVDPALLAAALAD
jgi:hypothetical protein